MKLPKRTALRAAYLCGYSYAVAGVSCELFGAIIIRDVLIGGASLFGLYLLCWCVPAEWA